MIYGFVVTDCLRGRIFLRAVQVVEVEGCQCRFGHNIVSAYSGVELYARIEPSVVYSTVMSVQSRPTLCTQGVLCIFFLEAPHAPQQ